MVMKEIKYSKELLVDFEKLISDFRFFMSLNLMHMEKGLSLECQAKMLELIRNSLDNSKVLVDFFETPVLSHELKNKEKLMKNLSNILTFLYQYLVYAEPILTTCKPDILQGRFSQIRQHYLDFNVKYFS